MLLCCKDTVELARWQGNQTCDKLRALLNASARINFSNGMGVWNLSQDRAMLLVSRWPHNATATCAWMFPTSRNVRPTRPLRHHMWPQPDDDFFQAPATT